MPTDDQIQTLARELAEGLYNDDTSYRKILWWCNEPKERKAEELECTLRFLLRRFYLADKEKAKAFYRGETFGELDFIELVSSRRILSSLFPEIAKEVEE